MEELSKEDAEKLDMLIQGLVRQKYLRTSFYSFCFALFLTCDLSIRWYLGMPMNVEVLVLATALLVCMWLDTWAVYVRQKRHLYGGNEQEVRELVKYILRKKATDPRA